MLDQESLLFASDATLAAVAGAALLVVAALAMLADRYRLRRRSADAVGCMPWTAIFLGCAFAGIIFLALAFSGWAKG